MKKLKILLFIFVLQPLATLAQSETVDTDAVKLEKVPAETHHFANVDSLQNVINELTKQIQILRESENTLKGAEYDNAQTMEKQRKEIERLNRKLLFADSVIARLSNDCLCKKYNRVEIEEAITNFSQMHSPELKSKLGMLTTLLKDYQKYWNEIESIFALTQNDTRLNNPFTGQKAAADYIDKIKQTQYYKNVYDANWTIPYLNVLIDKSIEVIHNFNPKENKSLHSQLLELIK